MLKTGNSDVSVCVGNLLAMQRGEVHVDQMRGIRAAVTDMPQSTAGAYLQADVYAVIEGYEPRTSYAAVALDASDAGQSRAGNFTLNTETTK